MIQVAKCLCYDGATETALVRTTDDSYVVVVGPVIVGQPPAILREGDTNYQSALLAYDALCLKRRRLNS